MTALLRVLSLAGLLLALTSTPVVTAQGGRAGGPGGGGGQSGGRGGGGGGGDEGYGNNLAVPAVFAEAYGFTGLPVYTDTGLRPRPEDPMPTQLEYFDPSAIYLKDGVAYYPQQTTSHWQAQWRAGSPGTPEGVTVNWSDNLVKQRWTLRSPIRIEHVLYQNPTDSMTAYAMQYLFGKGSSEMWGTAGVTLASTYRTVFTVAARLKVQKLLPDRSGLDTTVQGIDEAVYERFGVDGSGGYGAEVNVSGNLIYGYNWQLPSMPLTTAQKAGWWRITFQVDPVASYTITPEGGAPQVYTVPRNLNMQALDAADTTDVIFTPVLVDQWTTTLDIEITDRRVPRKPGNPGGGE